MALMRGKRLKYLRNHFSMLENDLEIWEMAKIFGKWLKQL